LHSPTPITIVPACLLACSLLPRKPSWLIMVSRCSEAATTPVVVMCRVYGTATGAGNDASNNNNHMTGAPKPKNGTVHDGRARGWFRDRHERKSRIMVGGDSRSATILKRTEQLPAGRLVSLLLDKSYATLTAWAAGNNGRFGRRLIHPYLQTGLLLLLLACSVDWSQRLPSCCSIATIIQKASNRRGESKGKTIGRVRYSLPISLRSTTNRDELRPTPPEVGSSHHWPMAGQTNGRPWSSSYAEQNDEQAKQTIEGTEGEERSTLGNVALRLRIGRRADGD
jgi:hypothetical protein